MTGKTVPLPYGWMHIGLEISLLLLFVAGITEFTTLHGGTKRGLAIRGIMTALTADILYRDMYRLPQQTLLFSPVWVVTVRAAPLLDRIPSVGVPESLFSIVVTPLTERNLVSLQIVVKLRTMGIMAGKTSILNGFVFYLLAKRGPVMTLKTDLVRHILEQCLVVRCMRVMAGYTLSFLQCAMYGLQ